MVRLKNCCIAIFFNALLLNNDRSDRRSYTGLKNKNVIIRNQQVMIDCDLAEMYGVETKVLNQAVKRNIQRFPERFHFQLTENEFEILRSQFVTSKTETRGGRQYLPYAFTEQGCAMLSAVFAVIIV